MILIEIHIWTKWLFSRWTWVSQFPLGPIHTPRPEEKFWR